MKTFFTFLVICIGCSYCPVLFSQDESTSASSEETIFTPTIHHSNIKAVTLFAQNPQIVTPVGIAVAPDGRVFVQENHTHKRTNDYRGPETDRILIFEDTNGDGIADTRSIFYEGHTFSTDLLFGPDGHLYVSTRWFIGRFRDAATKKKADAEPEKIIVCDTEGDYPHNGVGGLAIDPAHPEWLAFGFGENLGVEYTFVGSDGTKISGGSEGGSTYRCRTDGTGLTRQSTGHWNAFGMAYDLAGNLFSTDNDPNATPPNRLLHIVPGADFGYEYRYGRSGRHPLVCWFGENPGTLGMIGALGEAACGVIPYGPGKLLSASWTDNRVDLHVLQPHGDSFTASREPFLSGPDDFRPVHFSYSADGKYLYFTDWVKLSYPVHGHGRIWQVEFKQPVQMHPLPRTDVHQAMTVEESLVSLGSDDPYVRTRAIQFLTTHPEILLTHSFDAHPSSTARAHHAIALKRLDHQGQPSVIPKLLEDTSPNVRFVGIKWIADKNLTQYQTHLEKVLSRPNLKRKELRAVIASLAALAETSSKEFSPDDTLLELALDTNKTPRIRALALQCINVTHKQLTVDALSKLAQSEYPSIQREAVYSLVIHPDPNKQWPLARLAADSTLSDTLRADAVAGLTPSAAEHNGLLNLLSQSTSQTLSSEAARTLSAGITGRDLPEKPPVTDLEAWHALIDQSSRQPDRAVGRRLFFHSTLGGCYKCHAMNGRGNDVGPDLTTIRNQTGITRDWLLKHIINPNAEMAPYYRPQQLLTTDGKVLTGLIIGREGKKQAYVQTNGEIFFIQKTDIQERQELTTSIMPLGLLDGLNINEIQDLIAYVLEGEELPPDTDPNTVKAGTSKTNTQTHKQTQNKQQRPNVLFILTDDQRYDALSCMGHPYLKTPHIDRLASEGLLFKNHFCTTSLCSPSRASILSGLYAHTHGVSNNFTEYPKDMVSFPMRLQESGYETAYVGKWHMGEKNDMPRPGFDHFVTHKGQGKYFDTEFNFNGKDRRVVKGYYTTVVTDMAMDWIKDRESDKPWAIMVGHKAPHSFYFPEKKYEQAFDSVDIQYPQSAFTLDDKPAWFKKRLDTWHGIYGPLFGWRKKFPDKSPEAVKDFAKMVRAYWGTLLSVDDSVGRLYTFLEDRDELDNTLVVFTSDNGLLEGEHGMVDKRTGHDPSIRIPLVVRYPGLAVQGKVIPQITATIDFAPTILDICGAEPLEKVHGHSWKQLAQGDTSTQGDTSDWRTSFYYEYNYEHQFPYTPNVRALRTDRWKYIRYPHGDGSPDRHMEELYDLKVDSGENKNLINNDSYVDVVKDLRSELDRLIAVHGDGKPDEMPVDQGIQSGLPEESIR